MFSWRHFQLVLVYGTFGQLQPQLQSPQHCFGVAGDGSFNISPGLVFHSEKPCFCFPTALVQISCHNRHSKDNSHGNQLMGTTLLRISLTRARLIWKNPPGHKSWTGVEMHYRERAPRHRHTSPGRLWGSPGTTLSGLSGFWLYSAGSLYSYRADPGSKMCR